MRITSLIILTALVGCNSQPDVPDVNIDIDVIVPDDTEEPVDDAGPQATKRVGKKRIKS